MGNREALLAGAKRCLLERGYDRTSVRDIVAAAGGVSMAAIGYHYGSREALLNAALLEALDEWGTTLEQAIARSAAGDDDARYEQVWQVMIQSFVEQPQLWIASVEAFLQSQRSEDLRRQLAAGIQEGRRGIVAALSAVPEAMIPDDRVRSQGSVQMALITGIMTQWIVDPAHAPSAHEIVTGLRSLVAALDTQSAASANG